MAGISGADGELRWGYRLAGTLERFTVTKGEGRQMIVRGRVARADAFTLAQRPLVFIWPLGARRWTYAIDGFEYQHDQITAHLGARQER